MSRNPVSLADVAKRAGVHRATVSLAMRNHTRIPPATCRRIQRLAREMGYVPDVAVKELMMRVRKRSTTSGPTATLAWINLQAQGDAWHRIPWLSGYLAGARTRAQELGYGLDELWIREPGMNGRALARILAARGIRGVVVSSPQERYGRLQLDWSRFAAVTIERNLHRPEVDRVVPDYVGNTELALRQLWRGGARRVGLWLGRYQDIVSRHQITAAFLGWQHRLPGNAVRLEPMLPDLDHASSSRLFASWHRERRPDAVVCIDGVVARYAEEAGLCVPGDLRLVHLNLHPLCGIGTGIDQCHNALGALAVDMLVANLQQGRFAQAQPRRETLVSGIWRAGGDLLSAAGGGGL